MNLTLLLKSPRTQKGPTSLGDHEKFFVSLFWKDPSMGSDRRVRSRVSLYFPFQLGEPEYVSSIYLYSETVISTLFTQLVPPSNSSVKSRVVDLIVISVSKLLEFLELYILPHRRVVSTLHVSPVKIGLLSYNTGGENQLSCVRRSYTF